MMGDLGGVAQPELFARVPAVNNHGLNAEMQHVGDVMLLFAPGRAGDRSRTRDR